ncbi:MAG: efflux RND transporter permease subunit, partial [Bacteroidaceae bacterium]|nr:efflux RND transporter permease subunit [Bacteroidaceae bacterium]
RSTLIPTIAIPVALVGTFFVLYLFGFSLNLLTLSAMVLAIAIVVDDAIVVVEGVHAKLDMGYTSARKASLDAMSELGGAIVSITLVMMAVFVPVSFIGGTSGAFYRQFGITMAVAIGFSALNALTLSPALCAILLKPHGDTKSVGERLAIAHEAAKDQLKKKYAIKGKGLALALPPWLTLTLLALSIVAMVAGLFTSSNILLAIIAWAIAIVGVLGLFSDRFIAWFNEFYDRLLERYKVGVDRFIRRPVLSMVLVVASIVLLVFALQATPTTLVPNEDTGSLMGVVSMAPGTSQDRTEEVLSQVEKIVNASPLVDNAIVISGFSLMGGQGPSYGTLFIKLKPWEERNPIMESSTMVFINLYMEAQKAFKDAQVLFFPPPLIMGYGMSNGFTLNLQDRTGGELTAFQAVAKNFIAELEKRPEIQSAQTTFDTKFPQYIIDIDAAQCKRAGISPTDVLYTLQGYYGGLYSSNFNRFGKIYRVMVQGEQGQRANYESLNKVMVRNNRGEMAPITQFMTLTPTNGPDNITTFNMFTSIAINGNPAEGYTSGEAIKAVEEVAASSLPVGYSYEYSGLTREEQSSAGNTTAIVFLLCFVFIYLLLAAQYESYFLPLAVLLSSFIFIHGFGSLSMLPGMAGQMMNAIFGTAQNNIYVQISLIMLLGLLAKNAILIIEFALDRRKMGMSITAAALHGAAARLRPILMTSLAMIVGLLPLMFAFGVGANGNRALGMTAIGGMFIGMICQIFVVPALFRIFQGLQEKVKPIDFTDLHNEDAAADLEQYAHKS